MLGHTLAAEAEAEAALPHLGWSSLGDGPWRLADALAHIADFVGYLAFPTAGACDDVPESARACSYY